MVKKSNEKKLLKIFYNPLTYLFVTFFFAFFLRIYNISEVPFGFHRDELINTYIGRFVLLNGKDVYGNIFPLFYFNKFGDFPPIIPMYVMGVSTFIFGINEFASRFPAAFFGSLTVFPVYYLSQLLYKNRKIALLSSFFLAIIPWHITLSRMSAEGILAVFVFSLALALLLKGITQKILKFILFSLCLFLLTYFLYPSFRILTPLTLIPILFFSFPKRQKIIFGIGILVLFISTLMISSTYWGKARFNQTSIFTSAQVSNLIESLTSDEGNDHALRARIFHNKAIGYGKEFLHQYVGYFSPAILFLDGSTPFEYIVPDVGLLYITFVIGIGGFFILREIHIEKKVYYYYLYLLFITPLPAALTIDFTPHIHRALVMVIPIVLLLPLGFLKIIKITSNRKVQIIIVSLLCVSLVCEMIYFSHEYFYHLSFYKSTFKNDGYREVAEYVIQNQTKYKKIYMPYQNLPFYYLFYKNDFDSKYIGKFNLRSGHIRIDTIGNIIFTLSECPSEKLKNTTVKNILIVDDGNCKNLKQFVKIGSIERKDRTEAFKLLVPQK